MTPAQRARLLLKLADLIEANGDEIALARDTRQRHAVPHGQVRRRVRRGRKPALPRRLGHEDSRRHHQPQHARGLACLHAARAGGRGGADRAVEFSLRHGSGEDRAGAGGGLHRGVETRRTDAADHAAAGRADRRGGISRRRRQHRDRIRRDRGPRAGGARRRQQDCLHRFDQRGQGDPQSLRRESQTRDAGARRQIAGDHFSGRGTRTRHRSRGARDFHEFRPGVCRRFAAVRAREGVRARWSRAWWHARAS